MLRKIEKTMVVMGFLLISFANVSFAAGTTVLPGTEKKISDCKLVMNYVHMNSDNIRKAFADRVAGNINAEVGTITDVLGCGIKTGNISLWMIPYYIRYILEFVIQLGGLVAVGGIIYGGYLYLFAGISEDKDKGKKAILYSVSGIVLTFVAWAFVNIIIALLTS